MLRAIYLALGLGFTGMGFVGLFLPVLPTVPFLLVAVACFARSSPALEAWLLAHRAFGPMLADWRLRGAIPARAKAMALGGMILGFSVFYWQVAPSVSLALLVAGVMAAGCVYIFTRPTA